MDGIDFFVDTHAHIYLDEFSEDREAMLARCRNEHVRRIFMPNIDTTSIDAMLNLERDSEGTCFAMMGLHPCSVKKGFERDLYQIETWLNQRSFVAIGEIGTDLYWDKTYWNEQKDAFTTQIQWAKKFKLPIVIHCRESLDETIEIVESFQDGTLTGVFHCFGGSIEQAKKIIALKNFYLGIGGVATFKKSGLDLVLPHVPLENIVLETDSPYLAPVPFRGKRNEPSYIPHIADHVAKIKTLPLDNVKSSTTRNALKLFNQSV